MKSGVQLHDIILIVLLIKKRLFIKLLLFTGSLFAECKRGEGKTPSGKNVLCKTNSEIKPPIFLIICTNKRKKVLGNYQTHGRFGELTYSLQVIQKVELSVLIKRDVRTHYTYIPIYDMKLEN